MSWQDVRGFYEEQDDYEPPVPPEVAKLGAEVEAMKEVLEGYEKFEAMMIESCGEWFDEMPDDVYDEMMRLQALRNEVLGR